MLVIGWSDWTANHPWPPLFTTGFLVSTDAYMNLQLANTEEYIDGTFTGNLGEVLIRYALLCGLCMCTCACFLRTSVHTPRCNNVMYMRGVPEEEAAAAGGDEDS